MTIEGRRVFLVERYVPAPNTTTVASAAEQVTDSAVGIRHLCTLLVAAEDFCLSVFDAPDADAIAAMNELAGLSMHRIVEAEWFPGAGL